jgi:MiaB-like tRNA modifying enzyme
MKRLLKEVNYHGIGGPAIGSKIIDLVKQVSENKIVVAIEGALSTKPRIDLPRLRLNPYIGIIPISYGCLGSCAYCCVVFARGQVRSYRINEITKKVKNDITAGVKEFWLTSQDTACYGRDINTNLAELLKALIKIKGTFKIRVGMMTPNMAKKNIEELIQVFKSKKIFKFIHLPIQSGDNQVLKNMKRKYSVNDFKNLLFSLRSSFPRITIATDVICGFPLETKEAFNKTVNLIKETKPDIVNVSKYFSRPKTVFENYKKLNYSEINRRSRIITKVSKKIAYEKNKHWINWTGKIILDELGKVPDSLIGRNFAYKPVIIKRINNCNLGKFYRVKIKKAHPTYLEGQIIE